MRDVSWIASEPDVLIFVLTVCGVSCVCVQYKSSTALLQSHLSLLFPLAREAAGRALTVLCQRPELSTTVRGQYCVRALGQWRGSL